MADQEDEILYSGDSAYRYVDALIDEAGNELMVISPYISNFYVRKLIRASRKKRIMIITSNSSLGYGNSLLGGFAVHNIKGYAKPLLFLFILGIISAYLGFAYTTAIIAIIAIILSASAYRSYRRTESNMLVKVIKGRFVHEKLYIGEQLAISGSANLTYNGMHRNIEHIELTKDAGKIRQLRAHFEQIWNSG